MLTKGELGYRGDIDGLRAIAVLSVVLYHAGLPGFSGGFVGVDIFFVISGFLITQIIMKGIYAETFTVAGFYVRRAKRILPAYIVVTICAIVAGLVLLPPTELTSLSESVAASAFFLANFYFAGEMSYFQDAAEQLPLLHLWSLSVEEQFYLVWPLVALLLLARLPDRWRAPLLLTATVIALGVTEWALRTKSTTMVFFWSPFRAWELMLGALVAIAPVVSLKPGARLGAAIVAGLCIAVSVGFYRPGEPLFPGLAAVPPCLGAALAIYLGMLDTRNPLTVLLSNELLRRIGLISYSLYLWHWPIFAYCRVVFGSPMDPIVVAVAIAASFVLAAFSLRFVERPFQKARHRPTPILSTAGATLTVLFAVGAVGILLDGLPQRATSDTLALEATLDQSRISKHCLRQQEPELVAHQPDGCIWGSGQPTEVVWGDSHAAAYFVGMEGRWVATGQTIEFRGMQSCDPLWALGDRTPSGRAEAACELFNQSVLEGVASDPTIKRVLISGYWTSRIVDLGATRGDNVPAVQQDQLDQIEADATRIVRRLTSAGKEVILLGEVPAFPTGGGGCIRQQAFLRLPWTNCNSRRQWVDGVAGRINKVLSEVASLPNVSFVDPITVFCAAQNCSPYFGKEVDFRDRHHMSDAGSKRVTALLLTALQAD
jgi:peptidoglycan/LPS O-acetylase OafA/YrhL